ncbi:hypothetical protein B4U80_13268 [Leptotrombidium deliense]|uniref:F-box domain-containing protein n=1 Tax=Leptotrombidium deliense TaxID=299467 RepID=A0A443S9B6_9ACAR|nr:hypothetical protein B4U80_13268 [Leptotrombidium deliense]
MDPPDVPELPPEMWAHVFRQLPTKERLRVTSVSQTWNRMVSFTETHIACIEPFNREFMRFYRILYSGYKFCVIQTWTQLLGVIKKHPKMTHLKLYEIHFQNVVATTNEIQLVAKEIQDRENKIDKKVPLQSFRIDRCLGIQVVHFDAINHFRNLREFVWDGADTLENLMTSAVNDVLRTNQDTLMNLAVTSEAQNDLMLHIQEPLEGVTYDAVANTNREGFWQSLLDTSGDSLQKLVATVYSNEEMGSASLFVNLTDLRLFMASEYPFVFGINVEKLRVLTLLYKIDFAHPFNAVRRLFNGRHNNNLEILDIAMPLTDPVQLNEICLSSPNLRLLKLVINYNMQDDCVIAIRRLSYLRQLSLDIDILHGSLNEALLTAIITSPNLPDLRAILVPEMDFPGGAYARLAEKADQMPGELFFYSFSLDNDFVGPRHPRVIRIGTNIMPVLYFEPNNMVQNDYFMWTRITPNYFV